MSHLMEQIKHTVDATIPEKEELTHGIHPKLDYAMLILRNLFVGCAAVLFLLSFFIHSAYDVLKATGDFCGAAAYVFELLALTDCFTKKVPHTEMFMVYCFGPLYFLLGFHYIF